MSPVRHPSRGTERRTTACLAAAVLILTAACSGTLVPVTPTPAAPTETPAASSESPSAATETPTPKAEASPSGSAEPITVELAIETAAGAEEFHYVQTALEAPAGSTIKLELSNLTNPDDEIGHNWVLVAPGQEESVLASGIAAGDDGDWLDENDPGIIAAGQLIEGGQRDTVTFEAPPSGSYTFLCTFPEHYAGGMKGTLTIP
jgi:azurin